MLNFIFRLALNFILIFCFTEGYAQSEKQNKTSETRQKVILDTDIDSDVDDVGALAMLLNMHKSGSIDLIGVIVTSNDPFAPVCAEAINTFYGFPGIPVGFLKDQPALTNHSRYTKFIAGEFKSAMRSWEDAEDAVSLYRRLLLSSNMESVVILTIGHLSSLQRLLKSTPDQASPLSGQDLVKEKVEKWICMGGQFPEGKEANFYRPDPQSTLYCVNHWEKKVVFCGWEAGNKVITGGSRLKKTQDPGHPLYRAYELFNGFAGRQSWDQIAVLQLDCLTDKFFSFVTGHCIVNADGSNGWEDNPSGKHQYVKFNHMIDVDQVSEYIDNLMSGKEGLY